MNAHQKFFSFVLASAALAGGAVAIQAQAQGETSSSPAVSASPSATPSASPSSAAGISASLENETAINFLHHVNSLEMREAANAQFRVQGQAAQALVQALSTDHQQNEQQVTQLASQKGLVLFGFEPATFELAEQSVLSALDDASYDAIFMKHEAQSHQEVLTKLQSLQTQVTDADLGRLIAQTIPVVQRHLQLAQGQSAGATPRPSSSPSTQPSSSPGSQPGTAGGGTGY